MKASYLSVFQSKFKASTDLRFTGEQRGDELWNGKILAEEQEVGYVQNGVVCFVELKQNWPPDEFIEDLRKRRWIAHNWETEGQDGERNPLRRRFCDELAGIDGIILEVAAGPGGGNLSPVLRQNPSARIIVNDISIDVLDLWREFFQEKEEGENVCFAAFDVRERILCEGRIAAASNVGGLGNIEHGDNVIHEITKALRPGGVFFSFDAIVDPDDWSQMPPEKKNVWEKASSGLFCGYADLMTQAGLQIESKDITSGRVLDPEDSDLAKDAAKYGVKLHVSFEVIKARKPKYKDDTR